MPSDVYEAQAAALQGLTAMQRRRALQRKGPSDNDLVYQTRKWDRMLYGEYREQSTTIREVEGTGIQRNDRYPDFMREVFTRFYRPSAGRLAEATEGAQWAEKLHEVAEALPEFNSLRGRTRGDQLYSGMAASAICDKVAAQMKPTTSNLDLDQLRTRLDELCKMSDAFEDVNSDKPNPFSKRIEQGKDELAQAEEEAEALAQGLDAAKIRSAVRAGCQSAQQEIDQAQEAFDTFSYGTDPGTPSMRNDWQLKRQIADEVGKREMLQRLAVMAGRMRRIAATKRREKVDHAVDEITDIETGADLPRLLPTELLQLCDDELEALAFSRFSDRACLQYKLIGNEEQGKGAVIFAVDESGSMQGDRDLWAKAVSLAGLDNAARDKRPWGYVHFDSQVSRVDMITADDYKRPAHVAKVIMESMQHFTGGGTNFQLALDAALEMRAKIGDMKTADIVIITDGAAPLEERWIKQWNEKLAEYPCNLITVLIGGGSWGGKLEEISDHVFKLQDIMDSQCGDFYDHIFTV